MEEVIAAADAFGNGQVGHSFVGSPDWCRNQVGCPEHEL